MECAAISPGLTRITDQNASRWVAELHGRHARKIYNLALRFAADPAEAEDLTQEVFLRVVRKIHTLAPDRNPDAWLMRVAMRVFLNHRPCRPRPASLDQDPPARTGDVVDPEVLEEARRLLGRLPAARRLVFLLVHYESRTAAETAALTGLPVNTVKSHLKRARRTLSEILERRSSNELP